MKKQHSYPQTIMEYHSCKYAPQGIEYTQIMRLKKQEWNQITNF